MKSKYLVPLDGSELGERAIPWAKLLGQVLHRQVELLRCHDPLATVYMVPEFAAPATAHLNSELIHQEIDEYLQSQAERFEIEEASKVRREGEPATVMMEICETEKIAAIVMASHGRGGLGRWLLGSVTTKMVRGSRVPVLVINAATEVSTVPQVRKILVPLDGSDISETAIPYAIELAQGFGATILLYQAVTHPKIKNPQLKLAIDQEIRNTEEYLEGFKTSYPELNIETKVKAASQGLGIVEEATSCDIVVMSSHGRSGVKRWLLGSVTEKLLQSLNKPLFIAYERGD